MPKARARPISRRGADKSQVRLDVFLSPRGGVSQPPHLAAVGTLSSGSGSAFARCPACGADVAMRLMNDHLDSGKCASVSTAGGETRNDERTMRDGDARVRTAPADPRRPRRSVDRDPVDAKDVDDDDEANATRGATNAKNDAWTAFMRNSNEKRRGDESTSGRSLSGSLPGHFVVENFVTTAEETALVAFLDDRRRSGVWKPSTFNGKHLGKKWGVEVDLKRRTVASPGRRPMPPELLALAARLRDLAAEDLAAAPGGGGGESRRAMPRAASRAVATFAPNEANAIDYRRALGMELEPHCDDRQMSSGVLVNLSLLGDCVMTYAPDKKDFDKKHNTPNRSRGRGAVDVFLPRRSLQIQSGSTRYDFSHAIRNENLLADRRVSVTFRESAAPATRTKMRGG